MTFALQVVTAVFCSSVCGVGRARLPDPQNIAADLPVKGLPHLMQGSAPGSSSVFV
jgi:hypothetical protein